ncbi:MAG: GNAT family N-acetyltransferase [Alphaproteobacteria bacterium]|nr:GNAT family N-acetyltransferase [Alphaproteobacteria bacterium]MBU1513629.1 GNAT family N-acetyltransferase [Alphaproteobacteria bacterium]MBU2094726.1 GNAT family N-acetyltransferase [Alphaproteobacteria bacterium]MBU2150205.1 GNAT family N-acetyltransferase [Alphaproteobacteria bacterium]MBU2309266.1 GNAT family N-acetyltransferase [Alphaproteobacteria bacterium]
MTVLETERLVLREVEEADAPFVLELLNSPGFLENIGDRGVRTEDEARGYIVERVIGSYRQHGFGMWLTIQKLDQTAVGLAGLVKREGLETPDVGYAFAPRVWGQGYAQEAAAGVLAHAQGKMGLQKLAAITTLENFASMAVLRKIGFVYQGTIQLPGIDRESTHFTVG